MHAQAAVFGLLRLEAGNAHPLRAFLEAAGLGEWAAAGKGAAARQIGQGDLVAGAVIKGMPDYIKAVAERDRNVAF